MYKLRTVILVAALSCFLSTWGSFLVIDPKYKKETSLGLETYLETHNYIDVGTWVKTNDDYSRHVGKRVAGKVVELRDVLGEPYPVATLKDGRKISVFWLVRMKTQRG